jgi:hypothetical protein
MRSFLLQLALSTAIVSAKQSTLNLESLGLCSLPLIGSNSWNPICSSEGKTQDFKVENPDFKDNIHEAAQKPAEVLHSANFDPENSLWSYTPRCLREHNSTDKFCIYTKTDFAENRGISLFTTPEHANKFLRLPAFTNPEVNQDANKEPNPPYEMRALPGKGMGLIVNRTLQRGDHIFSNTPVLVIHEQVFEIFFKADRQPFATKGIRQLPEKTNKLYMDLAGHFGGDKIEDIINTNSFAVDMFIGDDETAYNAVFPEISVSS